MLRFSRSRPITLVETLKEDLRMTDNEIGDPIAFTSPKHFIGRAERLGSGKTFD